MNAKYLVKAPTYVRTSPGGSCVHMAAGATLVNPLPIEIDERVPPSRTWLPLNVAAQRALAAIGVEAEVVELPAPVERKEPGTMLEMTRARSKVVGVDHGVGVAGSPRPSDFDPVTGEPASPAAPRLAKDRK